MSALLEQIRADQLAARKAGMKENATTLTTLLGEASPSGTATVNDDQVLRVVQKFVKNIKETMGYTNNQEVIDRMNLEIIVLEKYIPTQLTADEIRSFASKVLVTLEGMRDEKKFGEVMKQLAAAYRGRYEGKLAMAVVAGMTELTKQVVDTSVK
jgi:uncharacterized protein YqeY